MMVKRYLFLLVVMIIFKTFTVQAQLKIGEKAPEIHITNWLKNTPKSRDLNKKFIVVDFWATWCAPCLESVPHMNNLVRKNSSRSNLIFLSLTDEKAEKVNGLLSRISFSSIVVSDTTQQTLDDFKVSYIPFCAVIDDKNVIRWVGNAADLSNEIITEIINKKEIIVEEKKSTPAPTETEKMYKSLSTRYLSYMDDKDLQEYFSMAPVTTQKQGFIYKRGGAKNYPYEEVVVGDSLVQRISTLLDIAENQITLPDDLYKACISYCYKSRVKYEKKQVLDTILNQLKLRYTVKDSLMNVIQLEVTDHNLLKKFIADSLLARVGHSSNSNSYAAIDNDDFANLTGSVQEQFKTIVVVNPDPVLNHKMSITIKIDNMPNLISSFRSYGIKATNGKKMLPVYHFKRKHNEN